MTQQEEIPYTKEEVEAMVKTIAQLRKEKQELVDRVCEWLDGIIYDYIELKHANVDTFIKIYNDKLIEDLRKAMEE